MAVFAGQARAPHPRSTLLRDAGANAEAATGKLDHLMRNWPDESDLRA